MKYSVQLNYTASIVVDVEANDEGEAYAKAREIAEEADAREFTIYGEGESQIIRQE